MAFFSLQNKQIREEGMEKSELARNDYESGMKYKDIATKHDVSINTVKSWQRRHNWTRIKKGAPKNPRGAPKGNKNAVGHGAPKGSQNALKHGLFAKYLPQEVYDIAQELSEKQPIDSVIFFDYNNEIITRTDSVGFCKITREKEVFIHAIILKKKDYITDTIYYYNKEINEWDSVYRGYNDTIVLKREKK